MTPFFLLFSLLLPMVAGAINVGDTLLGFGGTDVQGKPVDLNTAIGTQPVLLVFWASWCPNCKKELPKINILYNKYSPLGMSFIAVNVGINDSVMRAKSFLKKIQMPYPVLFDKKGKITKLFKIQSVPTILIADKNGQVVFKNFAVPAISDEGFLLLTQGVRQNNDLLFDRRQ